jgi:hypothetical protein
MVRVLITGTVSESTTGPSQKRPRHQQALKKRVQSTRRDRRQLAQHKFRLVAHLAVRDAMNTLS